MALLHELQVLQVELDLQQEQLRRPQAELETALMRQAGLVERALAGDMTIDARTVLCEIKRAGARLPGAAPDGVLGRPLAVFVAAHGAGALQALPVRARAGLACETCALQLAPIGGMQQSVHAAADRDTTPGRFLLLLMAAAITLPP